MTLARLPDETAKAHQALCDYANLGHTRSLAKLCELYGKKPSYVRQLQRWCSEYRWVERVAAWEAERQQQADDASRELWIERQKAQRELEWQLSNDLIQRAKVMLDYPIERKKTRQTHRIGRDGKIIIRQNVTISPTKWHLGTACAMVALASKLMRLATASPTERVAILTKADLQSMTDEEFAYIERKHGM